MVRDFSKKMSVQINELREQVRMKEGCIAGLKSYRQEQPNLRPELNQGISKVAMEIGEIRQKISHREDLHLNSLQMLLTKIKLTT